MINFWKDRKEKQINKHTEKVCGREGIGVSQGYSVGKHQERRQWGTRAWKITSGMTVSEENARLLGKATWPNKRAD